METTKFDDRRYLRRFDALLVLEFRSLTYNDGTFLGISRNFSADGLSFESREFRAMAGEPLEFKLSNPGDGASVSFMGEIAWKKMQDDYDCLTGIKLDAPDSLTLKQIFNIVSSSEDIPEDAFFPQMYSNEAADIDQPVDYITDSLERSYTLENETSGNAKWKYILLNTAIIIILLSSVYLLYMAFGLSPDKRDMHALPVDSFYHGEEIVLLRPERADLSSIMSPEKFRSLSGPPVAPRSKSALVRPPAAKSAAHRPEVNAIHEQRRPKRRPTEKIIVAGSTNAQTERSFIKTKNSFTKEAGNEPIQTGLTVSSSGPGIDTASVLTDEVNRLDDVSPDVQPQTPNNSRIIDAALVVRASPVSGQITDKKDNALLPYLVVASAPRVFFEDSFKNSNDWPVIDTGTNTAYIENGKYFIESSAGVSVFSVIGPDIKIADDYRIDTKLSSEYGTGSYSYGIVWGARDYTNYYSFKIKDDGEYIVSRISKGAQRVLTVGNSSRLFLNRKGNNLFSLVKRGNITSFYINDNFIYEISGLDPYGTRSGFIVDGRCRIVVENIRITSAG